MKTKLILSVAIGFVLTVALIILTASETPTAISPGDTSIFQNATNIVFREFIGMGTNRLGQEIPKWKEFTVSNPKEIRRLVSSIHLVPGGPEPNDEHLDQAIFEQAPGAIRVSFCHICFNIIESEHPYKDRHYSMPKEFFNEFQVLAREHGWKVERK